MLPTDSTEPSTAGDAKLKTRGVIKMVENANEVEFYVDDVLQHTDHEVPFNWELDTTRGLHTLEVRAKNGNYDSIDLVDFYLFSLFEIKIL